MRDILKHAGGKRRERPVMADAGDLAGGSVSEFVPYVFAGMALAAAIAFAGAYIGENASASTAPGSATALSFASLSPAADGESGGLGFASLDRTAGDGTGVETTHGVLRGSLLSQGEIAALDATAPSDQTVAKDGKSDGLFGMAEISSGADGQQMAAVSPPQWKLEQIFAAGSAEKRRRFAERRFQLTEQTCLARAVYFEARSESALGQQAVAQVILNRVKDPAYPKTICGVVYQGADKPHQCQFSFACDGGSDVPTNSSQWKQAQAVATRAMTGGDTETASIMGAATHYHADYVRPKWSYSLRRLIKIGRHIFYADS